MPSFYEDEEDIYKCTRHPSKRRRTGICPACLREVLLTLCPDCAHPRPCSCCCHSSTPISTRMSDLIDNEPSFRRSRSITLSFLRSRSREEADGDKGRISKTSSISFMRLLLFKKSTKSSSSIVMMRSSSMTSMSTGEERKGTSRRRGWNFASPINVLRQSKISKLLFVQQGSPLSSRG